MKKILLLLSLLLFLLPAAVPVHAEGEEERALEEAIEELVGELDTEDLQTFLDGLEGFGGASVKNLLTALIRGDGALDYGDILSGALSMFTEEGKSLLPAFALILAVSLLCALLDWMKNGVLQSTSSDIIHFVAYLSAGSVALALLTGLVGETFALVSSLKAQMELVLPILLTLMAASGGSVSAGVFRPAAAFLSGGIASLFMGVVLPVSVVLCVLTFVGHLTEHSPTEKLRELLGGCLKWLIGLSLALYGLLVTVQGLTAAQYDGFSLRAVRFLLAGSVPVVGGFLSGGAEFVLAGSALLKNAVGTLAVFMLFSVLLRPVILFAVFRLFLGFSAAATEPMGGKIPAFLSALAKDTGYLLAAMLAVAFLYFTTLVLIVCSAGVLL